MSKAEDRAHKQAMRDADVFGITIVGLKSCRDMPMLPTSRAMN